jgi:cytochrome c oxidase cbb3-type subunit 4
MDQGTIGTIFTLVVFISFIGVVWWAFSRRNTKRFEEAANLPFADEEQQQADTNKTQREQ